MNPRTTTSLGLLFLLVAACDSSSRPPPQSAPANGAYPAPGPYGQPQYGAYGPAPGGGYPPPPPGYGAAAPPAYAPPYGTAGAGYGAPSVPPGSGAPAPVPAYPQAAVPVTSDPISATDMGWLRGQSRQLMQELVAALPDAAKQRVQAVPLTTDDTPGEVNAAAACVKGGAVMVVTDGLLEIAAHLAQARANDDVFGTRKVDEYIQFVAARQKPNQPIVEPGNGFFLPAQQSDPRRVERQHQVFDETLGFVLGHELAHHHLGHLPCTGGTGPLGMGDLARGLSQNVPLFNQPNELAADTAGTENVIAAGGHRPGYRLTEGGGILMMQFFSALDQLSPEDILFGFERTHPPPQIRVPVIQQTANYFRATGTWIPLLRF